MGLTLKEKKALTRELSKQYQKSNKKEKTQILNVLAETAGYNRKYALHILTNWGKTTNVYLDGNAVKLKPPRKKKKGGGRKPAYSGQFIVVLRTIWAFFWYRCGKILSPFIRGQMKYLEKEARFRISPEIKKLLLSVSPATIDRLLKAEKKKLALTGKSLTKPGNILKKQIPVRTYYCDADKKPGFFEIDTVHHCGTSDSGEFCLTLSAADVDSGWIELRPLLNKAHKWVLEALQDIKSSLPFPLSGLDSDNGSEFINSALLKWCSQERIQFTRSRAYHKNDNCLRHKCRVEQKNNSCVRNFTGYDRFSSVSELDALARVYRSLCPLLNYFMPTHKLISKTRVGSKIKKVYDKNMLSPYQRLLASADLSDDVKNELVSRHGLYNPVKLQKEVHNAVDALLALKRQCNLEGAESLAASALQAI